MSSGQKGECELCVVRYVMVSRVSNFCRFLNLYVRFSKGLGSARHDRWFLTDVARAASVEVTVRFSHIVESWMQKERREEYCVYCMVFSFSTCVKSERRRMSGSAWGGHPP